MRTGVLNSDLCRGEANEPYYVEPSKFFCTTEISPTKNRIEKMLLLL